MDCGLKFGLMRSSITTVSYPFNEPYDQFRIITVETVQEKRVSYAQYCMYICTPESGKSRARSLVISVYLLGDGYRAFGCSRLIIDIPNA